MTPAVSAASSVSALAAHQFAIGSTAPSQTPDVKSATHVDINAPFYISPAISFDPITSIVIVTFRDGETGKIRQQIPPEEALDRYRSVDETGMPDPFLRAKQKSAAKNAATTALSLDATPEPAPAPKRAPSLPAATKLAPPSKLA